MRILQVRALDGWRLSVVSEDGREGTFDTRPYLELEAFQDLRNPDDFAKISNGGYFIEWACGADLSADTIEARWTVSEPAVPSAGA